MYKEHLKKKKKKLQERNKIPRTKALKEHKQAIKDESKQVLFTVTNNPALPNIQDIPRKKQPILYSTERLKTKSTKKSLLSLSYAHLIFVTYSFVKKTRKHRQFTPAVTPNTDASPAHTLIMGERRRTLSSTQEKQETQDIMLLYGLT